MNELEFKLIKDNKEITFYVMATYHDDNMNKNFIIYTDNTYNKENNLNIYYSLYEIINNNIKLIPIKNNQERKICLELIKELVKKIKQE